MKMSAWLSPLLCAALLAGCAAAPAQSGAPSAPQSRPGESASVSAATPPAPAPPQAQLPQLEYETPPFSPKKKPAPSFGQAAYSFTVQPAQAQNAYKLALGLYNNDKQAVVEACFGEGANPDAEYAYDMGLSFPFNDLEGLVVTDFTLYGGTYEIPMLSLTVAEPGATGLQKGNRSYNIQFADGGDSAFPEGVVTWLSPWSRSDWPSSALAAVQQFRDHGGPEGAFAGTEELRGAPGTGGYLLFMLYSETGKTEFTADEVRAAARDYLGLDDYDPGAGPFVLPPGGAAMGPSYGWVNLGVAWEEDGTCIQVIGHCTDGLGIGIDRALGYRLRPVEGGDGEAYRILSCGEWPLPASSGVLYAAAVPAGNVLSEAEREILCAGINRQLAGYRDRTYPDMETVFSGWDPMLPIPKAVTPDALRTETVTRGSNPRPHLQAWVPLPESHWAVFQCWLDEFDQGSYGIVFYAVPRNP